ncbi:hypothetical protein [Mycobacteroides chelonae]|uniref:hypothetical protein n=1 Tax=Mycobacteroides chelonae TaxID=1774 RepID=UPI001F2B95BA|nr:hypothetical protein [Mycobacteroides chelonae]
MILLRPVGGMGVGIPPIAQGLPGKHAQIDSTVAVTELDWDDPTAVGWSWSTLTPPDDDTPGVYRLNAVTRTGRPGNDGNTVWDPTDLSETPVAGQIPAVNSGGTGFELVAQRTPEVFYPGTVNNTASGNQNSTLAQIAIPARPYARRVLGVGHTVVTGEAADVRVDLIARLNGESGGNIIGRCPGIAQTERLVMTPGKAAGLADAYDTIAANASATVYIRCERQAGTSTYTTSASSTLCHALVLPL